MERNTDIDLTEASLILDLLPYNPNNINLTFNVKKKQNIKLYHKGYITSTWSQKLLLEVANEVTELFWIIRENKIYK